MKRATAIIGRTQMRPNCTQTQRQECNAIAAMLNDVATESYEELRAIRHALLTQSGPGRRFDNLSLGQIQLVAWRLASRRVVLI